MLEKTIEETLQMKHIIQGIHSAVATPVTKDGTPDLRLLSEHCRSLLKEGCHGIALLGSTGEANSFGLKDRITILEAAINCTNAPEAFLPGTSTPAIADTIELTRHAVSVGAKGVVLLPPYYYKGVSDEGIFRYYSGLIEGIGDDRLRVVLYHIPQISQIPISFDLIDRLMKAYPDIIVGIKDSSGKLENLQNLCKQHPKLAVLTGSDPLMLPLLQMGGAGCITATSNLCAEELRIIWDNWGRINTAGKLKASQDKIVKWRTLSKKYDQLATIKTMLAERYQEDGWLHMVPPLVELQPLQQQIVWSEMKRLDP